MGTSFWWLNQTQCPHKKSFISRRILYFKLWYVHFKPWYVHFKPWYVYFKPWNIKLIGVMRKKTSGRSKIVVGEAKRKQTGLLFFQSKCCMFAHPYSLTRLLNHPSNLLRNMKTKQLLMLGFLAIVLAACGAKSKKTNEMGKRTQVKIETTQGDILVELYNETPQHRDNFIKLAKQGTYDNTLFHRVIREFMIQAGDPDSKEASDSASLGSGDVGYTIPAEIVPQFYHKKGTLAAARMGDEVNPKKESSGCQFYIVTGRKFREAQLLDMVAQKNNNRVKTIFSQLQAKHAKEFFKLRKTQDKLGLIALQDSLEAQAYELAKQQETPGFTPEQITAYTTIGGAPHLDGEYTIFGQVLEGIETVEKIEAAKTGRADRPVENIRILKMTVVE